MGIALSEGLHLANLGIGDGNTAIGGSALLNTTNGIYNTAIGYNALAGTNVTQVNDNTAVGAFAGRNLTRGSGNIYLRHFGVDGDDNTMRLGQSETRVFIAGIRGPGIEGIGAGGQPVLINAQARLGVSSSSARYKRDIQTMDTRSRGL